MDDTCCTCASIISLNPPISEKPHPPRSLACCNRLICASCIAKTPRFSSYCPFCQVSDKPNALPQGGLRDPPVYSSPPSSPHPRQHFSPTNAHDYEAMDEELPTYASLDTPRKLATSEKRAPDVTHHLKAGDSISSLSLAYKVPIDILRQYNTLFSDHLLQARRTITIPGSHYTDGVSLSAEPVETPEEVERKGKLRKFMVGAKCHEYHIAELYLAQTGGDLEEALRRWREDEKWERDNPMKGKAKAAQRTGRRRALSTGLTGQMG